MAKLGLEWLWRIKEEPRLWRRYWHDGQVLLRLALTQALPLALAARWQRLRFARSGQELHVDKAEEGAAVTLHLAGDATAPYVASATSEFRAALNSQKQLLIDLSATRRIDSRFFWPAADVKETARRLGTSPSIYWYFLADREIIPPQRCCLPVTA